MSETLHTQQPGASRLATTRPVLVIAVVVVVLSSVFLRLETKHSVNTLFADQIEMYFAYEAAPTFWQRFTIQYGPPRMGLGGELTWQLAKWSRWDTRVESHVSLALLIATTVLALLLKRRLVGPLSYYDLAIVLMFLTLSQVQPLIEHPFLGHGQLALFLILVYCLAWTIETAWLRYACVSVLNFFVLFTGFGLFIGGITLAILASQVLVDVTRSRIALPAISAGAALLSLGLFLHGYQVQSGCFTSPDSHAWTYPAFAGLMLSKSLGLNFAIAPMLFGPSVVIGLGFLVAFTAAAVSGVQHLFRSRCENPSFIVVGTLLTFCLSFVWFTAVGRSCFGLIASQGARYSTLVAPGFLGFYLWLLSPASSGLVRFTTRLYLPRRTILALFLAALSVNHVGLLLRGDADLWPLSDAKRRWIGCYLALESVEQCNERTSFAIFPPEDRGYLQKRLEFLKQHQLAFYSER